MIKKILGDLNIKAYMDNLRLWSIRSFDDHMLIVDQVLKRLTESGVKGNPLKCQWAVQKTSFLGHPYDA